MRDGLKLGQDLGLGVTERCGRNGLAGGFSAGLVDSIFLMPTPSAPLSRLCRITSEIILSFVPKQGSIYGPIRFARALMIACGKETRAYIRPHTWKMFHLPGPDGICASSPNQVNGLGRPCPPQVLKKLVSPLSPSCLAQASRLGHPQLRYRT